MQDSRGFPWNHFSLGIALHGGRGAGGILCSNFVQLGWEAKERICQLPWGKMFEKWEVRWCFFASGSEERFPQSLVTWGCWPESTLGMEVGLGRNSSSKRSGTRPLRTGRRLETQWYVSRKDCRRFKWWTWRFSFMLTHRWCSIAGLLKHEEVHVRFLSCVLIQFLF